MIHERPLPAGIETRLSTLGGALAPVPTLVFAYLFGGAGTARLKRLSDVDLAVYVDEAGDAIESGLSALHAATSHLGTDEVDLVILNTAPTALVGRVLQTRRVILDRDPYARHRFESLALRMFCDFRLLEHQILSARFARG
jgi:predicted nucleotidyltransferase